MYGFDTFRTSVEDLQFTANPLVNNGKLTVVVCPTNLIREFWFKEMCDHVCNEYTLDRFIFMPTLKIIKDKWTGKETHFKFLEQIRNDCLRGYPRQETRICLPF